MTFSWLAARGVGALVAVAACMAAEPALVHPRDPGVLVERLARRLDWRDGLPVSYLANVAQDPQGFLWVSGPGGLSRYDGNAFTTVYSGGCMLVPDCTVSGRIIIGAA